MQFDSLLFAQAPLHVIAMKITPQGVTLDTIPVAEAGFCPCCAQRSARIHSHHCRTLADVPAHGQVVCIRMHLRRFTRGKQFFRAHKFPKVNLATRKFNRNR